MLNGNSRAQMTTDSFGYTPLSDQEGVFRLLRLKKGTGRNIECELVHTTLDAENNRYEAVSYTWGRKEEADILLLHGKQLPITLNLSVILRDLRSPDTDRILWTDAICINQNDNTERGCQVQQMKDIFKNAKYVLFYISQPTPMTDLLMTTLQDFQNENSNYNLTFDNDQLSTLWRDTQSRLKSRHYALEQRQREGLEHILNQSWFSRVWILQEVANARDALVYCGRKFISANIFAISLRLVNIHPQSQQYQPVIDLMSASSIKYREGGYARDLYSLLRMFSSAEATDERDKIYALLGMCTDKMSTLKADYNKSVKEVIRDTLCHLCRCEPQSISEVPYISVMDFLNDLQSLGSKVL
jgi:hypothetical protein